MPLFINETSLFHLLTLLQNAHHYNLFSANPLDLALFCACFLSFFRNFTEIYKINLHISRFFRNFAPKRCKGADAPKNMCRMIIDNNDIPKQDYMVLCSTITYNQAQYITDTMNGFCMQQTNFPFVCYIIDDASMDGEQDMIEAYLNEHFQMEVAEHYELELANVIVAKHITNPNCTFAVYLLKRNLWKEPDLKYSHRKPWTNRCKYIALCEGDDYWTDPLKL